MKSTILFLIYLNQEGKWRLLKDNVISDSIKIEVPISEMSDEAKAVLAIIYKVHLETVLQEKKTYNILTKEEVLSELDNMYKELETIRQKILEV